MSQIETELILGLIQARWKSGGIEAVAEQIPSQSIDWQVFIDEATAERVGPLIYLETRDRKLFPPEVEFELRRQFFQAGQRNLLLRNELAAILQRLAEAQVKALALKGAAIIETSYKTFAQRPMRDIDLLVAEEQFPRALSVMAELGYCQTDPERQVNWSGHAIDFIKTQPARLRVEIHWSLFDTTLYRPPINLDWFWQTARPFQFSNAQGWMPGPEAQVMYLCAHLMLHHRGSGLLWWYDLALLLHSASQPLDWELLFSRAQKIELVLPLQAILPTLAAEWQAPIPQQSLNHLGQLKASPAEKVYYTARIQPERFSRGAEGSSATWGLIEDLTRQTNWRERLDLVWASLLPSPTYMTFRYQIRRPWLMPVYYLYRWLRGLTGLVGRQIRS